MGRAAGDRHLKIYIRRFWVCVWGVPIQHPPPIVSRVGHAVFLVHWVLMSRVSKFAVFLVHWILLSGVSIFENLKPWGGLLGTGT